MRESIFKICHTKWPIGNRPCATKPPPSCAPLHLCRWAYESPVATTAKPVVQRFGAMSNCAAAGANPEAVAVAVATLHCSVLRSAAAAAVRGRSELGRRCAPLSRSSRATQRGRWVCESPGAQASALKHPAVQRCRAHSRARGRWLRAEMPCSCRKAHIRAAAKSGQSGNHFLVCASRFLKFAIQNERSEIGRVQLNPSSRAKQCLGAGVYMRSPGSVGGFSECAEACHRRLGITVPVSLIEASLRSGSPAECSGTAASAAFSAPVYWRCGFGHSARTVKLRHRRRCGFACQR